MKKYKISKNFIHEFFGIFDKKKKTPKEIDDLIKNDPVLQKLDKEMGDINKKAANRLKKDKEYMKLLKKYNIDLD